MGSNTGWTNDEEINWDNVDDSAPKPLDPGLYVGRVAACDPQKTKSGGKPGAKLELTVKGKYGEDAFPRPRKMFATLTFTQDAGFAAKNFSKANGIEMPSRNNPDAIADYCDRALAVGDVFFKVKRDSYEGKPTAKIERFYTEAQAVIAHAGGDPENPDAPAATDAGTPDATGAFPAQRRRRR